ncbi:GNAT family protein [Anaerolentibacter hominis]|uniref:GNAT family N-acetyltransferase n=1 Tax=Anaerolentibacter hominis TaxID=3079009 RepID=UPI0031B80541
MKFELKKWDAAYIDDVTHFANNAKVAANLRNVFPHPYTRTDAKEYILACAADPEERQICRAIVAEGHAAGSVGIFCGSDVYEKSAELGYWLAEEYWGRGIMTEAVKRLCRDAFAKFDIVRIYAEPYARNTGSRRVLEKAGFTLEGIMRRGVYKNGEVLDYCMYGLLKEELDQT